jgi:hypothetical protein
MQVIAHEMGHSLGLQHAGSWTCTSGGVRVQGDDCRGRRGGEQDGCGDPDTVRPINAVRRLGIEFEKAVSSTRFTASS